MKNSCAAPIIVSLLKKALKNNKKPHMFRVNHSELQSLELGNIGICC